MAKPGSGAEVLILSPVLFPLYDAAGSLGYFNWNISMYLCFRKAVFTRAKPQVILVTLAHISAIFRGVISSVNTGTYQ